MTFGVPKNASSPVSLMQPEAPFLLAMRAFESLQEFQMEWWRAWSGLMGQVTPSDTLPEAQETAAAEAEQPQAETSSEASPEASEAA
ncbi:hypothetical protein [Novosphingobium naphthalenivorans]|uniref:hypothetical protein n=1 Tax=Novosphingobium naphthalenivorans TaxID=273168 RepID=UPI000833106D|nr:hypothetical protein [Novosphingobium naphthalenivorans]